MANDGSKVTQGTLALRSALERKGWTQADLARELGCNSGLVSRWFTGAQTPKIEMASRIERLLKIKMILWARPVASAA